MLGFSSLMNVSASADAGFTGVGISLCAQAC